MLRKVKYVKVKKVVTSNEFYDSVILERQNGVKEKKALFLQIVLIFAYSKRLVRKIVTTP